MEIFFINMLFGTAETLFTQWHCVYSLNGIVFIHSMALCLFTQWHCVYSLNGIVFIDYSTGDACFTSLYKSCDV